MTTGTHGTDALESAILCLYESRQDPTEVKMKAEVQQALEEIRPMLQADGGDVELVDVTENGVVSVRLQGACQGCPMSQMTIKNGIERLLKERVAGVTEVVSA